MPGNGQAVGRVGSMGSSHFIIKGIHSVRECYLKHGARPHPYPNLYSSILRYRVLRPIPSNSAVRVLFPLV